VCRRKGLIGDDCKKEIDACVAGQDQAVTNAGVFFDELTVETTKPKAKYSEAPTLFKATPGARARIYFSSDDDKANKIDCTAFDVMSPPSANAFEKSPFRVRGVADDLYVDRGDNTFKSTSQASVTFSGDRSTTPTQTLKSKAALGYAYQVNGTTLAIPYFSFYQSITDTFGKVQSTDPASNVAVGMLFTSTVPGDVITQAFSVKPQYLLNTKDRSEIGSMRLSYTPYTYFGGGSPNLNFFQPVSYSPIPLYAEILFDLRLDAGVLRKSRNRSGSKSYQQVLRPDRISLRVFADNRSELSVIYAGSRGNLPLRVFRNGPKPQYFRGFAHVQP